MIKNLLNYPHDCEYEKTYCPFIILKKKKYVGNKYEHDFNKFYQDFSGIVLKRRDNAPIVKEICGGIINQLLEGKENINIKNYTKTCLQNMFDGKYNIKYFLQSRNLKSKDSYKDWTKIAHMALADRITKRDSGNEIQSGTRLEYAVIKTKNNSKNVLQSDIIESIDYINKNNLQIDYLFYLTNQISKPALQFLELIDKSAICIFNDVMNYYTKTKEEKLLIELKEMKKNIKLLKLKGSKMRLKYNEIHKIFNNLISCDNIIKLKNIIHKIKIIKTSNFFD
jgi:DNA polymerase elongation subunit (family B)